MRASPALVLRTAEGTHGAFRRACTDNQSVPSRGQKVSSTVPGSPGMVECQCSDPGYAFRLPISFVENPNSRETRRTARRTWSEFGSRRRGTRKVFRAGPGARGAFLEGSARTDWLRDVLSSTQDMRRLVQAKEGPCSKRF